MEAENSITLTIYSGEHVFIALRWRSEMIMGFHEYTYQDREYVIRAMNTKLSSSVHMLVHSAGNQTLYIWVFLLQAARTIALCHSEHICDHVS